MTNIEKSLRENGVFVGKTLGDSMCPMLKSGRDTVVVVLPQFPLKKYDVPVYKRNDHITMHRIVKVTKKGYVICGDNRTNLEKDISDKDIIGVLQGFYQDGVYTDVKDKEYIKYSKKVCRGYCWRLLKRYIKSALSHVRYNKPN